MLIAFTVVLFISFTLIGTIFNIAITMSSDGPEIALAETDALEGRVRLILIVIVSVVFAVSLIASYFLSNSITKPIEKLGEFATNIGKGEFIPNDFDFNELELENLNKALNKSVQQLSVYDSEQKAFFQNASHELRTPLMSIKCYAEGISVGIMDPKKASETILEETDRLSDLVSNVLCLSQVDSIKTAYDTEKTDLIEIIIDCVNRQQALADQKQIQFIYDFGDSSIFCNCSKPLMKRALDNLVSNAIRYASKEIMISCHERDGFAIICVLDDGDGISPEVLPHVFERFYKGPGGIHGIGLSMVKSIVEQHNGTITAKNNEDGGAELTIMLPSV